MKKFFFYILTSAFCILVYSCGKEGPGGKAGIKGVVKHHEKPIPGAIVYIKYGAKEFPGTNVTYYDASANTDANANYEFPDLKRGDYYLFGVGTDNVQGNIVTVSGGIPVEIKNKTGTVEIDVPVSE